MASVTLIDLDSFQMMDIKGHQQWLESILKKPLLHHLVVQLKTVGLNIIMAFGLPTSLSCLSLYPSPLTWRWCYLLFLLRRIPLLFWFCFFLCKLASQYSVLLLLNIQHLLSTNIYSMPCMQLILCCTVLGFNAFYPYISISNKAWTTTLCQLTLSAASPSLAEPWVSLKETGSWENATQHGMQ